MLRTLAATVGVRAADPEPSAFQIHQLSARLETEQIEAIVRRYEAGESARALAIECEIAPSALLRLLRERKVVVRRQLVTAELEVDMAQAYEAGMTMAELETKHGLSHGAVLRALHRSDVEIRAKAPRRKSV